jgi:hypothetical protein
MGFVFPALQQGTPTIDGFAALTVDQAVLGGHAFMNTAPGLSFLALPFVAMADMLASLAGMSTASRGGPI